MKSRILALMVIGLSLVTRAVHAEEYPIFVEQDLSSSSVYVGEQSLYSFVLNTQVSVFNYQAPETTIEHAWSEVIAVNQRYRRIIEGEVWNAFSTRRAIYPLSPGTLEIPALKVPVGIKVRVRRKVPAPYDFGDAFSQDFLEEFFADTVSKKIELSTKALRLEVKPLPEAPADLRTISPYIPVGTTNISARITRNAVAVGESVTLEATVVSTGNLNPVNALNLAPPRGARLYPESPKIVRNENNGALIARKTFRYSLVPVEPGTYKIPPIRLVFFEPEKGEYQLAETAALEFSASGEAIQDAQLPAPAETSPPVTTPAPTPTAAAPAESLYSRISARVSPEMQLLILAAVTVALLVLAGIVIVRRKGRKLRQFRRDLKAVSSLSELSALLRTLLGETLGQPAELMSYEQLLALVKRRKLPSEIEFLTLSLLDTLERSRFSKGAIVENSLPALKIETLKLASVILAT